MEEIAVHATDFDFIISKFSLNLRFGFEVVSLLSSLSTFHFVFLEFRCFVVSLKPSIKI